MAQSVKPEGERLRSAVRWLSEHAQVNRELIDRAARRFDLSPLEEEFLHQQLLRRPTSKSKPGRGSF